MDTAIKVLESEVESLKSRVELGISVYPLVEEYKKQIIDLEFAIDNLKMLELFRST